MVYKRLGDMLVSVGLLTEEDINKALELQKESGKRLGAVLIESKMISEEQLIEALQMQLGVDFVDLSKVTIGPELTKLVPKSIAKRHSLVPVKLERGELFIAMSDPLNFVAIEEVKQSSHHRVIPMITTDEAVEKAIMRLYGIEGAARAIEEMRADLGSEDLTMATVITTNVSDETAGAPTIRLVNSIIERAVTERASDIHLEPREGEMVVRMRIDGVLRPVLTVPRELQSSVISRLKVMGGMDTSERKIPQDGRTNVQLKMNDYDLRISTLPTIYDEKMVLRILDKNVKFLTKDGIGLDEVNKKRYEYLMRNTSGVFLIAGPTGSGKSSTMSTMLKELNTDEVNIVTLEDPVEYNISGVNQVQVNEKVDMTFANGLRSILRQDPDIISIGEIRDGETAEIAMRSAITGHLVLSTIHTSDSIAVLDRLFDIGVPAYLTSSALKGVIAQRLVRRVCTHCREEYTPTAEELDLIGMDPEFSGHFYRGKGCASCGGTGYSGRIGVFEILTINRDIRRMINTRAGRDELEAAAKETGFVSIAERCRQMVLEGITTASEAARTIHSTNE